MHTGLLSSVQIKNCVHKEVTSRPIFVPYTAFKPVLWPLGERTWSGCPRESRLKHRALKVALGSLPLQVWEVGFCI